MPYSACAWARGSVECRLTWAHASPLLPQAYRLQAATPGFMDPARVAPARGNMVNAPKPGQRWYSVFLWDPLPRLGAFHGMGERGHAVGIAVGAGG